MGRPLLLPPAPALLALLLLALGAAPQPSQAMILYDTENMSKIMCAMNGSVILSVWPQMAIAAGIAVLATMMRAAVGPDEYIIQDVKGHATLGTALAFLNVFRSNLSYGRYWDGRGQLGTMVKSGRELSRKLVTYCRVPADPNDEKDQLEALTDAVRLLNCLHKSIVLAVANLETFKKIEQYPWAKLTEPEPVIDPTGKYPLRAAEQSAIEKAEGLTGAQDGKGRPILVATLLSHQIYYMYEKNWINAAVLKKCDIEIDNYVGAWMACEKIAGVPMVFPYTQMLTLFLVLFVYTFPLPLAHIFFNEDAEFNGFIITPFVSALVAFAFFGMNAVGIEIENPFGQDANDLPMAAMCARVGKDSAAILDLRGSEANPCNPYIAKVVLPERAKAAQRRRAAEQTAVVPPGGRALGRTSFAHP